MQSVSTDSYSLALGEYVRTRSEAALYQASMLSIAFIQQGLGPDDIIPIHVEALDTVLGSSLPEDHARIVADAHQFLLEVMIAFGAKYREHLEYRLAEGIREAEERAATDRERALNASQAERETADILARVRQLAEERARLATEVEEERRTLATVLGCMTDGLVVVDGAQHIRYCNRAAGELLRVDPEELIGKTPLEAFALVRKQFVDPESTWATWRNAIASFGQRPTIDARLIGPPRRTVRAHVFPVDEPAAEQSGIGVLLVDVTDSRLLALLKERERLALERERIAMDLHDGVIQSLYAVGLSLAAREHNLDDDVEKTRRALREGVNSLNKVMEDVRSYIFQLRPSGDEQSVFSVAVEAIAAELRTRTGLEVVLDLDRALEPQLPTRVTWNLLQLAREAIVNSVRHAQATRLHISFSSSNRYLVLSVRDNGRGFDVAEGQGQGGDGLHNMAERARAIGGKLAIDSRPGHGTELRVEAPMTETGEAFLEEPWANQR